MKEKGARHSTRIVRRPVQIEQPVVVIIAPDPPGGLDAEPYRKACGRERPCGQLAEQSTSITHRRYKEIKPAIVVHVGPGGAKRSANDRTAHYLSKPAVIAVEKIGAVEVIYVK